MSGVATDLRAALRAFRKSPGSAAVVVATIALGVGANATIFGVVDSIFLRPLPFRDAGRLVRVRDGRRSPDGQETRFNVSTAHFLEIARRLGAFEAIAAQSVDNGTLLGGAEPERVAVVRVSPGTWGLFGGPPARGRVSPRRIEGLGRAVEAAPGVPLYEAAPMDRVRRDAPSQERLGAVATILFGAVGLLLAEFGKFGIAAYAARRRARELAIRAALGAVIVFAGSPFLSRWLEQPARRPILLFAALAALLSAMSALASVAPGRQAARTDPMNALRED